MAQLRHFTLVVIISVVALLFNQLSLRDVIPGPVGLRNPALEGPQPTLGERSFQRPDVGSGPHTSVSDPMPGAPTDRLPRVTIVSLSNSQRYCDKNALQNAMLQDYPHTKLDFIMLETSSTPNPFWRGHGDTPSGADDMLSSWQRRGGEPGLTIVYRWYNSSAEPRTRANPSLGDLRNIAIELSEGQAIVNMDNDDFYHPNYVRYVVGHLIDGPFSELRLAPTATALMNPDGTLEITADASNVRYGGHVMSFIKAEVLKPYPVFQNLLVRVEVEEEVGGAACSTPDTPALGDGTAGGAVACIAGKSYPWGTVTASHAAAKLSSSSAAGCNAECGASARCQFWDWDGAVCNLRADAGSTADGAGEGSARTANRMYEGQMCPSNEWLGMHPPTAADCMALIMERGATCNQEFFNYADGGDRNCGCVFDPNNTCASPLNHEPYKGVSAFRIGAPGDNAIAGGRKGCCFASPPKTTKPVKTRVTQWASCGYRGKTQISEDRWFTECLERNYPDNTTVMTMTNGSLGSDHLMVKFDSPLSITRQRMGKNRKWYNRLKYDAFEHIITRQQKAYDTLHELSRPARHPPVHVPTTSRQKPIESSWVSFVEKNRDYFADDNWPVCAGFANMPGTVFRPRSGAAVVTRAKSAAACCSECRRRFNATFAAELGQYTHQVPWNDDPAGRGHCGGWSFDRAGRVCTLGAGVSVSTPESMSSHESGIRVSGCKICGQALAVSDP